MSIDQKEEQQKKEEQDTIKAKALALIVCGNTEEETAAEICARLKKAALAQNRADASGTPTVPKKTEEWHPRRVWMARERPLPEGKKLVTTKGGAEYVRDVNGCLRRVQSRSLTKKG